MHTPPPPAARRSRLPRLALSLTLLGSACALVLTLFAAPPRIVPTTAPATIAPNTIAPPPASATDKTDPITFSTPPSLGLEARALVQLLENYHYNRDAVKPENYGEVITNYMKDLDTQRLFFLQPDADDFNKRNPARNIYWNLTGLGRIEPAYEIYAVYEKRVRERAQWIFDHLKDDIDLTATDTYAYDRKEASWPATQADADALWQKRLKFEILQEVLSYKAPKSAAPDTDEPSAGITAPDTPAPAAPAAPPAIEPAKPKTPEEILADARTTVRKRYERILKNLDDITSNDLAEMFLSRVSQLYDPHSTYFSADTYEDFSINMRLQLFGIGALLSLDPSSDVCVIKEIIPGGPADLSKQLRPNDKIIAVAQDGQEPVEIIGMKLRRIVEKIRGPKGTKVHLTIQPGTSTDDTERRVVTLVRDVVNLDSARAHAAIFEVPTPAPNPKLKILNTQSPPRPSAASESLPSRPSTAATPLPKATRTAPAATSKNSSPASRPPASTASSSTCAPTAAASSPKPSKSPASSSNPAPSFKSVPTTAKSKSTAPTTNRSPTTAPSPCSSPASVPRPPKSWPALLKITDAPLSSVINPRMAKAPSSKSSK